MTVRCWERWRRLSLQVHTVMVQPTDLLSGFRAAAAAVGLLLLPFQIALSPCMDRLPSRGLPCAQIPC